MKLIALFATAAFAAHDEQVLDEYVDMMMRQASGEGSDSAETDLDEAIEAKHGHGPHGHGPHGHNPHRHCPHDHYYWNGGCTANCGGGNQQRWRQYDSNAGADGCQWSSYHASNHGCNTHACPTPYPTPFPTPFPTPHPCDDGSHGCDTNDGVCYKTGGNGWSCGCKGGNWCISGCSQPHVGHNCVKITANPTAYPTPAPTSYPTPQPTMYPTPYPTPYPTANPTAAPTATCPVTCEIDNGQFVNKQVYGYKNFDSKSKYGTKLYKRLVTTHNLEVINEQDSYAKHRCYKYGADQCTCECIDDEAFFMDTTHKGKNADQSIQTIATLKATGKFWKAPNYWISHTEIKAVKKCCAEEVAINPEFIIPAHSCADVLAATDEVIKTRIEELEPTTSNTKIINWLKAQGCYN